MSVYLFVQGLDPVELAGDETFNKVRHRGNKAMQRRIDLENGNIDGKSEGQKFDPMHQLSFKTAEGGRISVNPEKFIGVGSDTEKDSASSGDEE